MWVIGDRCCINVITNVRSSNFVWNQQENTLVNFQLLSYYTVNQRVKQGKGGTISINRNEISINNICWHVFYKYANKLTYLCTLLHNTWRYCNSSAEQPPEVNGTLPTIAMDFESGLRQTNTTDYTLTSPRRHIEVLFLNGCHATPVNEEF